MDLDFSKIKVIILKEWAEVFRNRLVLFSVAFMPLIFVAMPFFAMASMEKALDADPQELADIPDAALSTFCANLEGLECGQVYMASIFTVLFLILPVMIPVTIAAYSIVGEKSTRSLEPLLATPITTTELLVGKAVSAVTPALVATWISYLIYVVGMKFLATDAAFRAASDTMWILAIFALAPLLSLFAVSVAVLISSRVNDPRVAEQLSGVVVLPIVLFLIGQSIGFLIIDRALIVVAIVVMLAVDVGMIYLGVKTFEREAILTRWK